MEIQAVTSPAFRKYGRVVEGIDFTGLMKAMEATPTPDGVVYEPSIPELEALDVFAALRDSAYGGLPIQIGYCNGDNHTLNAVEYHRSSEINVACTDMILLIGMQQDIDPDSFEYDTAKMEAFLVPAGTAVEVYATTLHYAPISSGGKFRVVVVLPKGTNEPLTFTPAKEGEDALLFAQNKWLIAHPESGLDKDGAFIGLTGENITI
ncbi:DUF4867 family protein [Christensenella tenuis]|jgi:hypothetical protein|uniref:DUF4867 family protein n=1 Tax=Christensenella tenuis TaxID=2763033 RepID=A0ABR7EFY6_9FIRM|nr:DUF4867 family protein [Christensenella tenuis]MBC5648321.1 DUF4867 family protein [Christensenella tenuis]